MRIVTHKIFGAVLILFAAAVCSQSASGQHPWAGEYFYGEDGGETAGGTNIYIAHTIKVTEREGKIGAHIYSQGFQTSRDIIAEGIPEGNFLKLYFRAKGPDHTFGRFEIGDHLLTLYRDGEVVRTCWGKFLPALESNLDNGEIRFTRVTGAQTGSIGGGGIYRLKEVLGYRPDRINIVDISLL